MILIQITAFEICDLLQNLRREISNLPDILRQCLLNITKRDQIPNFIKRLDRINFNLSCHSFEILLGE